MISKIENRFSSLYIELYSFIFLFLIYKELLFLRSPLSFSFCVDLVKRDNVRYRAINGCCCCSFHRGPWQSWDGVAVPVSVSIPVFVTVPQTAGWHQTTGAATVAASVGGYQRTAPRGARLLPQHLRGTVGQETVEQQVVVFIRRSWCSCCGSHHHVVMLTRQRRMAINKQSDL